MLGTADKLRHMKMCSLVIRMDGTGAAGTMLGITDKLRHMKYCSLVTRKRW